jgi:hypothetical protein
MHMVVRKNVVKMKNGNKKIESMIILRLVVACFIEAFSVTSVQRQGNQISL